MADMIKLKEIAKRYGLKLIEDATESLGTYYTSGPLEGQFSGTIGDIGIYSFNGNKIITTGGGGMIVSENAMYLERAKHLTTQAKSDPLYYTHDEVGYNYRMTNLQAALGLAQLEQLEAFIEIKKENYEAYKLGIDKIEGLELLEFRDNIRPNYWFYSVYCKEKYPLKRNALIEYLSECKIQVRPVWGLISNQIPYKENQSYEIVKSEDYVQNIINIPCSSNLTVEDVQRVLECLADTGR
jgi:dTDP-4-amino-4,6-dideoxygalactose transaminase